MIKGKFSKFIVTLVIVLNIVFTVAVLAIFLATKDEPATLIGCWFAFTTVEVWALAGIRKAKTKEEKDA